MNIRLLALLSALAFAAPSVAQQPQPTLSPIAQAEAEKAVKAMKEREAAEGEEVPAFDPTAPENMLNLDLSTGGRVTILMRPDIAPRHVERIRGLAQQGFYDGVIFHRVIPGFMAQTGDPTGTGQGGSPLPDLEAEFSKVPHLRGTVSAARTQEPNSANSQFFITFMPNSALDKQYSVFGRVTSGMQFVDAIAVGEPPAEPSRIVRATIGTDVPPLPRAQLLAAAAAPMSASAAALASQMPEGIEADAGPDAAPAEGPVDGPVDGPVADPAAAPSPVPDAVVPTDEDAAETVDDELDGRTPPEDEEVDTLVDAPADAPTR